MEKPNAKKAYSDADFAVITVLSNVWSTKSVEV